jgi:phospho-N-acetylmuramoyl-pentapeptide-transferase
MVGILFAGVVSFIVTLIGTHYYIQFLNKKNLGQFIRDDGPKSHFTKRGTPTMGGIIIIIAVIIGYAFSLLISWKTPGISGILIMILFVGLGFVGFLDDYTKVKKQKSLGLKIHTKLILQGIVGIAFALLSVVRFPGRHDLRPASLHISFIKDTPIDFEFAGRTIGIILFVIWVNFLITAWSNAVNLSDGLDGLAIGTSAISFGAYIILIFWQLSHICTKDLSINCYVLRGPRDLAMICAAITGACIGFLWWNASPAKIFMGDTGSLALGGAFAGISILSRTEILAMFIGGLFVLIIFSDVIQIAVFKITGKRVFKMAPLHHHFELMGWQEITIVVRFWIIAIVFAAFGVAIFYGVWVVL